MSRKHCLKRDSWSWVSFDFVTFAAVLCSRFSIESSLSVTFCVLFTSPHHHITAKPSNPPKIVCSRPLYSQPIDCSTPTLTLGLRASAQTTITQPSSSLTPLPTSPNTIPKLPLPDHRRNNRIRRLQSNFHDLISLTSATHRNRDNAASP